MSPKNPAVLALIPARSGSKSIPHKNIRTFHGKPLLAHSIEQALGASSVGRVIVDTDSDDYAAIARKHGAETPYRRPAALAGDLSTDLEAFQHALGWLAEHENYRPSIIVHLRPTYPNRTSDDIDRAVAALEAHPAWDCVRSVTPAAFTPYKMWFRGDDGGLTPVVRVPGKESYSMPRQALPTAYEQTACVDVIRARTILSLNSMAGENVGSFVMEHDYDIDTPEQMAAAEAAFTQGTLPSGKTFVVDMDGVLASLTPGNDYNLAQPLQDNIDRINRLHAAGNRIVIFTARGSATGLDWAAVTRRQLDTWGVKYHDLKLGKPAADYYIDDRLVDIRCFDRCR